MELFKRLEQAIHQQSREGELPEFLREPLLAIASNPEKFTPHSETVAQLLEQVDHFDAYAGAGCFGDSYGPEDILRTLMQLSTAD